jgi:ABC-type microcin C transport system permease subunit YejB
MEKLSKIKFIKENLKNPIFVNYLGRKGLDINHLKNQYTFDKNVDESVDGDYLLIQQYKQYFDNNKVIEQLEKQF